MARRWTVWSTKYVQSVKLLICQEFKAIASHRPIVAIVAIQNSYTLQNAATPATVTIATASNTADSKLQTVYTESQKQLKSDIANRII
jgi:hypothetical protein